MTVSKIIYNLSNIWIVEYFCCLLFLLSSNRVRVR